ncbi:MAG: TIM-barrel domain-containing protein [Phycisphaerales bacterium]
MRVSAAGRACFVAAMLALWAPAAFAQPAAGGGGAGGVGEKELIGTGIARFFAAGAKPAAALPSFALKNPAKKTGDLPASWVVLPAFSQAADGRQVATIAAPAGTSFYGTGEVAGPLLRNGRQVTLWNTDAFGYTVEKNPSLYQSHPWVLAVRPNGTAFGVLADTTWRTDIKTDGAITFTAEGPAFPVIIIDRASPQEVLKGLAELTGTMEMPPKWAIGYQQCRYSYNPEKRVREIAEGFRSRKIPCDVIWFDIDYMDGYRVFTFDKAQFPNPTKLNADLHGMGFRTVWMIDPGVKDEKGYFVRDQMIEKDLAVKSSSGTVFNGAVWPGMCVFPDYTSDTVRTWWAGLYKDFIGTGIDGVWNDMNEPAVFGVASKTMPEDNLHAGGTWRSEPGAAEVKITPGPHARFHNVYGMLMAQGTRDGVMAVQPGKRPFVLTRAGYLGSHRYSATWTGDNSATWTDLEASIPMALNLGLSGQPFCGPDIGGFNGSHTGDKANKGRFFARWMGIGSLLPFSRGHTAKGNDDKEPWSFDAQTEATCKIALERRYRLLPYYYTLFYEAHTTGLPVVRPAFFADLTDPALRSEDDCFLIGADVLVVPQFMPDGSRAPVEPKGLWRSFEVVDSASGGGGGGGNADLPALKIRGGAIVPIGPSMEWSDQKPLDPLTLIVCLDANGNASGTLYEDAGDGWGFKGGEFLKATYTASTASGVVTVKVASTEGKMARPKRGIVVQVIADGGKVFSANGTDGETISVSMK